MYKHFLNKFSFLFIAFLFSSLLVAQNSKFDFNQFEKRNSSQQIASLTNNEQVAAADVKYSPTVTKIYSWDTLN